jgi:cellulase
MTGAAPHMWDEYKRCEAHRQSKGIKLDAEHSLSHAL